MKDRRDYDYLPPEPLLTALEVLWVKAFGANRANAYEESDGMSFKMTRHRAKGLVRDWSAFDELCELTGLLERLGCKLQNGTRLSDALDQMFPRRDKGS